MSDVARLAALPIWPGQPDIAPLPGGLTNRNYLVSAAGRRFVARVGGDVRHHGVNRHIDHAVSLAAAAAGMSPAVRHAADDILVLDHVDGRTLEAADFGIASVVSSVLALVDRISDLPVPPTAPRRDPMAVLARGPTLAALDLPRELLDRLAAFKARALVHGDLHPSNILHDGRRVWLVDWEYAGLGEPASDLASLSVNAGVDRETAAGWARRAGIASHDFDLLRLAAAIRDLDWGLAQALADPAFGATEYIAINRARVAAMFANL